MGLKKLRKTCRFALNALFTQKPRIGYISGFQGRKNLGDEALYSALKRLFSCGNFIDYDRGLLPDFAVRRLPACRLMLMAGGTTICSQKEAALRWAKTCFTRSPHRFIFGAGAVSPDFMTVVSGASPDVHKQWADVLRQCDYIGVRGPLSKNTLSDIGISNVEVIGDPVMTLAPEQLPDAPPEDNKVIGFNVGQSRGKVWGSEQRIREQFVKLARIVSKAGFRIKWFVVWPPDLPVTEQVIRDSGVPADVLEIYEDYDNFLETVRRADVFVGMKLHATALATCACVPCVMLEYNPKCRDYMESIGQAQNNLRTDKFTAEAAWEMINNLLAAKTSVSQNLFETITRFRKLQASRASQICENIGLK